MYPCLCYESSWWFHMCERNQHLHNSLCPLINQRPPHLRYSLRITQSTGWSPVSLYAIPLPIEQIVKRPSRLDVLLIPPAFLGNGIAQNAC
jgi:hypothetical protein